MSKISILIVEDEAIIAYDLACKVRQLGYEVVATTSTGEEAIQLAQRHRPALVLMDIQLAGAIDGIAAAQQIYQECNLPIIFLTANFDLCTDERALQAGIVGSIRKPFDKHDISAQIRKAMNESPAA